MLHTYVIVWLFTLQNEIEVNQNELKWNNSIVIQRKYVLYVWLLHCCFHRNDKFVAWKIFFYFLHILIFNIPCEKENKIIIKYTCKYILFQEFLKYWLIPSPIKICTIKNSISVKFKRKDAIQLFYLILDNTIKK